MDRLRQRQPDSSQAFVATWFSPDLARVFDDGFSVGIAAAGYKPVRVDLVEHAGKIDDEIIAQIKRSKFVVADFTGQRGGVYFEAGFALGLSLPRDHVTQWTKRAPMGPVSAFAERVTIQSENASVEDHGKK